MIKSFKPFSAYEQIRLEREMSEENRAVLEAELEEKIQERIALMDEWADGYYTYDEALERDQMLGSDIQDILAALNS